MAYTIDGNLDAMFANWRGEPKHAADQIEAAAQPLAEVIAADARGNHPYQTRTGALEAGTVAYVARVDETTVEFGVTVDASVQSPQGYYYPYQIEYGNDQRFQTLKPARDRAEPAVVAKLKEIQP